MKAVNNETDRKIDIAKSNYQKEIENKLNNSNNTNLFWSVVNRLVGNKKITNIPPLLENDVFITSFDEKANIFNNYFAKQCNPMENDSVLPLFRSLSVNKLSEINIDASKIISIINKLNAKKAHGHDDIAISMLKIAKDEVALPLKIIFEKCLLTGKYPSLWKKANVQPVHKKSSRQDKQNYRPISLLPIFGKILEKIVFDQVYYYLNSHNLVSKNQSGFRPGDSTIYQLISITSNIYESFEKYDETRAVFLDISKAFDKVWHEGIIYKLKCNGISGNLLNFFENYLHNRYQRVVLNGTDSNWKRLHAGVPQGSVLGPLLFLVYINDLTDNISSHMRLFADDSSLFTRVEGVQQTQEKIVNDLKTVTTWAHQWKMVFNPDLTKQAIEVIFSVKKKKPEHPELVLNGVPVARHVHTKHLGIYLDSGLNFSKQIREAVLKALKGVSLLKYLSKYVARNVLDLSYKLYVRPHLDYGDVIYHNQRDDLMKLIEQVQYKAALIVSGCWQGTSREKLYDELGWESLDERRWARRLATFYKIKNGLAPSYLSDHIPEHCETNTSFRVRNTRAPFSRTERYDNSFFPYCIKNWNNLEDSVKSLPSLTCFKKHLNNFIRPKGNSFFGIRDKVGIKLITKIRVDFSDLRDHRYNHNFNCVSPTCSCGAEDETSVHYFLCCPRYTVQRTILLSKISEIMASDVSAIPNEHLTYIILYGSNVFNSISNRLIIEESILYINSTGRFKKLEAFT